MPDRRFLDWPFLDDRHRTLAHDLERWCDEHRLSARHHDFADDAGLDAECRQLAKLLGNGGWLRHCVPAPFGHDAVLDVRSLCIIRETLARHNGLADFVFAMQGLGSGTIGLFGTAGQKARYLPGVADGTRIAAFALTELDSGSDAAALATTATRVAEGWRLDGAKTYISNGGIASHYVMFARTGEAPGAKGVSAFVVDADARGLSVSQRIRVTAPHPLATIRLDGVIVPEGAVLGLPGQGFRAAMATLDIFRTTVGAAALGFARRALDEARARTTGRRLFGAPLSDNAVVQGQLGDMAMAIDAAALLIYRAGWVRDVQGARPTREAAMAKLFATEAAQTVVDTAVQMHGGLGVVHGHIVESLYREVRALRIYEGASEVQRMIIARLLLAEPA